MKSLTRALAIIGLIAPVMAGCATYDNAKVAPAEAQPISVVYSKDGPSGWSNDLPMGTYQVPNSSVIIAGHQEGGGIGILFGVAGMLVQSAVNTGIGKGKVENVQDALHIDLVPQANELTQKILASNRFGQTFSTSADPNGPVLSVIAYTVITYVNDTEVRPYVILKASLKKNPSGSAEWSTRYIASVGAPVPLVGDNSLTANGGQMLRSAVSQDLDKAVNVMLDDVANRHVRDETKMDYVEANYPFMKPKLAVHGYVLADDGPWLVFVPKIGDVLVLSGVSILDKSVIVYRPAAADDKTRIMDDK
jgi:hypothetical protein